MPDTVLTAKTSKVSTLKVLIIWTRGWTKTSENSRKVVTKVGHSLL